jgi:hypothetical protein
LPNYRLSPEYQIQKRRRQLIYSFDLSNWESGDFTATRFSDNVAVGGDWVCCADDDGDALKQAQLAASEDWNAPDDREWNDFTVQFVNGRSITSK